MDNHTHHRSHRSDLYLLLVGRQVSPRLQKLPTIPRRFTNFLGAFRQLCDVPPPFALCAECGAVIPQRFCNSRKYCFKCPVSPTLLRLPTAPLIDYLRRTYPYVPGKMHHTAVSIHGIDFEEAAYHYYYPGVATASVKRQLFRLVAKTDADGYCIDRTCCSFGRHPYEIYDDMWEEWANG